MDTPARRHGPLGKAIGGYYLGGGKDIRPDAAGHKIPLRGHTTYVSIAQGPGAFPRTAWIDGFSRGGGRGNYVMELKVYGAATPKSVPVPDGVMAAKPTDRYYSWLQLLAGDLDPLLDQIADKVASLPYPLHIQVCSERDTDHQKGGTIGGRQFTWQQLDALSIAGVQRLITRFRDRGCDNVTFSAGIGGWDHDSFVRSYVPGVDAVQYNAYNHAGWTSAADTLGRTYKWLPDLPAESLRLPVMVAEYGCQKSTSRNSQAAWIRDVPAALAGLPRIAYAAYFNSGWGTISDPASLDALGAAYSSDPFLQ